MDVEVEKTTNLAEKKNFLALSRKNLYFLLLLCYLTPIFISLGYALTFADAKSTRLLFLTVMIATAAGIGGALFLLHGFERKMQRCVAAIVKEKLESIKKPEEDELLASYQEKIKQLHSYIQELRNGYEHQIDLLHSSAAKSKAQVEELSVEMDKKLEEVRGAYLEYEDVRKENVRLQEENALLRKEAEEGLKHKDSLLTEYQHTISEQRIIIEKKQHYVSRLESKVRDLMYEIRSLLQLEEHTLPPSSAPPVEISDQSVNEKEFDQYYIPSRKERAATPFDLSHALGRYLETAEKFTGVDHLGYLGGKSPRFLDVSVDTYAIDLRRFFDTLREENSHVLFVYSQMEQKLLFVNNHVRTVLGWNPDKFIKDFPQLVEDGFNQLQEAMGRINSVKESQLRLAIRCKTGQDQLFHCFLGAISHGPFLNHVIGILSPVEE